MAPLQRRLLEGLLLGGGASCTASEGAASDRRKPEEINLCLLTFNCWSLHPLISPSSLTPEPSFFSLPRLTGDQGVSRNPPVSDRSGP